MKHYYLRGVVDFAKIAGSTQIYTVQGEDGTYRLAYNLPYTLKTGQAYYFYGMFSADDPMKNTIQVQFVMPADN